MRKNKKIINISLLMRRAINELENNKGRTPDELVTQGRKRKTAIKLAELLIRKLLIEKGFFPTDKNIKTLMKTEIIKKAAEGTNFNCSTEELNFFFNNN